MHEKISALARRQHGVVSRAQLLAKGFTRGEVTTLLRQTITLHAGVYALPSSPDTFHRRLQAAVLAAGGEAVASRTAAAFALGLGELEPKLEIMVPRRQRPRLRGVEVHRTRFLPRHHRIWVREIPVTSAPRTLLDLAEDLPFADLEYTCDHGLSRRGLRLTCDALREVLAEMPRHPGRANVLKLLVARPNDHPLVGSRREQELHALLREEGFGQFSPQHEVHLEAATYYVDVAFPGAMLAIEFDSYLHHSSRTDWVKDQTKHRDLVALGWRVMSVTQEDLREGRARFVARLEAALGLAVLRP